ncbi:MAG: IS607 family transposase [Promethearchaeota archaeon]
MLTISEVSRLIGASVVTLRRWDRARTLRAHRTLGNHRRYSWAQIGDYIPEHLSHIVPDNDLIRSNESPLKETYVYARVSSAKQKHDGNLDRQVERLVEYCHREFGKKAPIRVIHEYGSGLNPHRRGLWRLLRTIQEERVARVIISYKDRLTRFGFPFLEAICRIYGVPIIEVEVNVSATLGFKKSKDIPPREVKTTPKVRNLSKLRRNQSDPRDRTSKKTNNETELPLHNSITFTC